MRRLPDAGIHPADAHATDAPAEAERGSRSRDAAGTRMLLLDAARVRFALNGYSATTVRDIAADAGVNVALINRYFDSKEGLFEACLHRAVEDLGSPADSTMTLELILETIITQLCALPTGEHPVQLLLLLRTSGDERADRIRRNTLLSYSEDIAKAAGRQPGAADADELLLRAQIALSAALGIVLLRSSTQLEPLASAGAAELREPLSAVLSALLSRPPQPPSSAARDLSGHGPERSIRL